MVLLHLHGPSPALMCENDEPALSWGASPSVPASTALDFRWLLAHQSGSFTLSGSCR